MFQPPPDQANFSFETGAIADLVLQLFVQELNDVLLRPLHTVVVTSMTDSDFSL